MNHDRQGSASRIAQGARWGVGLALVTALIRGISVFVGVAAVAALAIRSTRQRSPVVS